MISSGCPPLLSTPASTSPLRTSSDLVAGKEQAFGTTMKATTPAVRLPVPGPLVRILILQTRGNKRLMSYLFTQLLTRIGNIILKGALSLKTGGNVRYWDRAHKCSDTHNNLKSAPL